MVCSRRNLKDGGAVLSVDIVNRMRDGHLVAHYLLASYAYYILQESPMTDTAYDRLCARLLERFQYIKHQHKRLISVDSLRAGTGYNIPADKYPSMVTFDIYGYIAKCINGTLARELEPHLLPKQTTISRRVVRRTPVAAAPPPEPVQSIPTVRRIVRRR